MADARSFLARDLEADRRSEFLARGHKERNFFPHRIVRLPKAGPDGFQLAGRMCGPVRPDQLWELVLYALPPVLDQLPVDLFCDDDLVWHQQQFGLPGQVASVNLVDRRPDLFAMVFVSDVVQRIGRRRPLKTQVENWFKGWSRLLVHACLDFALDRGFDRLFVATADLAHRHTDPSRDVGRDLFDHIYDHSVGTPFVATQDGRLVAPRCEGQCRVRDEAGAPVRADRARPRNLRLPRHRTGMGTSGRGTGGFSADAERFSPLHLARMLRGGGWSGSQGHLRPWALS